MSAVLQTSSAAVLQRAGGIKEDRLEAARHQLLEHSTPFPTESSPLYGSTAAPL